MKIIYLPSYKKQFKKLPKDIQEKFVKKEKTFRNNPFDSVLKTHKLNGHLESFWSFSVDYSYRAIFKFADNGDVWIYQIGDHDIYE
jgi:mRNA interferase YafQ